jgi:enoyl-CoA hydratase/carnithine racemase
LPSQVEANPLTAYAQAMESSAPLAIEDIGNVRVLRLNRPEKLNAFNGPLLQALIDAVKAIKRDDSVHCFIITGTPRLDGRPVFSAGDDLEEAASGQAPKGNPGGELTRLIDDLLKPSIAVIDGICTTGALEIAMACDLRFVAETAAISDWHLARLGLGIGGWGASTRLTRLVGVAQAKDLILTGKVIDGSEALRIGLAQRVYPSAILWEESLKAAQAVASMSPSGVQATMMHLSHVEDMSKAEALAYAKQVREAIPTTGTFQDKAKSVLGKEKGKGN